MAPPHQLHQLLDLSATRTPDAIALFFKEQVVSYGELARNSDLLAEGLRQCGLKEGERAVVFLPKQPETVTSFFAVSKADAVLVPANPLLKPAQVAHILQDSGASWLITSSARLRALGPVVADCPALKHILLVDQGECPLLPQKRYTWDEMRATERPATAVRGGDDLAAILYTSGSTGRPKGVMLSHNNLLTGAESVADYLGNHADDRLLAVLPFSFDYGLSQLTTAFRAGAAVVLMEYLLPRDVIRAAERYRVTGIAAIPPLWNQLAQLEWPEAVRHRLRYLTTSGGAMPPATTRALRKALPQSAIYLMYGLTEAFRSTYLPPELVETHPDSIGRAIPHAEIQVLRPDGTPCNTGESGELVHSGPLVALGYWNNPQATAERFRPLRTPDGGAVRAVWSGDQVRRDADGLHYFVGRDDEMIKSSGYRISPTEIEEVVFQLPGITQAAAFAAPHPMLGQAIVLIVQSDTPTLTPEQITRHCREQLPPFMVPALVEIDNSLPCNANGKIDRVQLARYYHHCFQ